VWLGSSGISNACHGNARREEVFCNAVAGEFLAPRDVFMALWNASTAELPGAWPAWRNAFTSVA